ncbi:MAG: flippase-like domain-containing protein [Nonlabens sp.]|nr:flippase-like domain-containing protein [Nonlabens sp.]
MKKKGFKLLKIVLPLALGLFLILRSYFSFTPQELDVIKNEIAGANYYWVALGMLAALLSHLSRAWRWNYMLDSLGFKPSFLTNTTAIGVGYAMNTLIPRSGEVSRAVIVNRSDQVPVDKAFGTIVAERVLDLIALSLIAVTAVVLSGRLLIDFMWVVVSDAFAKANSLKIAVYLIILLVIAIIVRLILKRLKMLDKLKTFLAGLKDGFNTIWTMKKKWLYLAHTIFIWAMYVVMFYVNIFALEATQNLSIAAVLCAFVAGSLAIAFTNGGFGAYPYLVAQVLLLFGLVETAGTSLGWLLWLSQTALVIIYGLISFSILSVVNSRSDK